MENEVLKECLTLMSQMREERFKAASLLREYPDSIPILLEMIIKDDEEYGLRGGWALDLALQKDLHLILPSLDKFCDGLLKLTNESAIRAFAKICEALLIAYFQKMDKPVINCLKPEHMETMTEACFDWLIGDHKVAAKAFAMTSLYELGKEYDWVHPELKIILQRDYEEGSAGFRSRARKVLDKLKNSSA
ncbi:MAG: adenylosuccinate lyase [Bacteroidia bacterium]|nr:adenylosuccinate lyase [Bacteroidia bacterium]